MNKKLLYLVIVLAGILIVPKTLMNGMFMDGQQYACVAQNMSNGKGTFWHPYLSETWQKAGSNAFMEHPPLGFFLESIAFKALGNSLYTERIFSLFLFSLSVLLFFLLIREWPFTHQQRSMLYWLSLLFWLSVPLSSWSIQNNMWENFLVFFGLFSLCLQSHAFRKNRKWLFLPAGILITAGFLCKGVPALFPLAGPILLGVFVYKTSVKKSLSAFLLLVCGILLPFLIMIQNAEALEALDFYLNDRLLYRVQHEPTGDSQWTILFSLINELLPMVVLCLIAFFVFRKKVAFGANPFFIAALLIGLSASLPLMATSVQRGFYLVPAFPWFALSAAVWCLPALEKTLPQVHRQWENRLKITGIIIGVLLIIAVAFTAGKPSRDAKILDDVDKIANLTGNDVIIGAPDDLMGHWNTQFYFIRFHQISLHCGSTQHHWYLRKKGDPPLDGFVLMGSFQEYDLYRSTKDLVENHLN